MEVFVCCSLETCIARDEKGVYQKAFSGEAATVPGVQAPYEIAAPPDLTVNTEEDTPQACAGAVISRLEELDFLPGGEDRTQPNSDA
jgi:adenylylsulfate kinase